jgi:hypothetical protein
VKRTLAALVIAVVASIGVLGCGSGTPGGPGATAKDNSTHIGPADRTFTLSVPTIQNRMKQGEAHQYTIGIHRGNNFDQDVSIKVEGLPQGVSMEPASPVIKHSDTEVKILLKAAEDAAVGESTIKVIGHPTTGADATNQFTLHIDKK